jgi:hypothetical protein
MLKAAEVKVVNPDTAKLNAYPSSFLSRVRSANVATPLDVACVVVPPRDPDPAATVTAAEYDPTLTTFDPLSTTEIATEATLASAQFGITDCVNWVAIPLAMLNVFVTASKLFEDTLRAKPSPFTSKTRSENVATPLERAGERVFEVAERVVELPVGSVSSDTVTEPEAVVTVAPPLSATLTVNDGTALDAESVTVATANCVMGPYATLNALEATDSPPLSVAVKTKPVPPMSIVISASVATPFDKVFDSVPPKTAVFPVVSVVIVSVVVGFDVLTTFEHASTADIVNKTKEPAAEFAMELIERAVASPLVTSKLLEATETIGSVALANVRVKLPEHAINKSVNAAEPAEAMVTEVVPVKVAEDVTVTVATEEGHSAPAASTTCTVTVPTVPSADVGTVLTTRFAGTPAR